MQSESSERLADLVEQAFELQGKQRTDFIAEACGENEGLRREVEALLGEQQRASKLMATPAIELGATLLSEDEYQDGELSPGESLGDYRVLRLLGEGGMGEVYLAEDTKLGRQVAIKLIKSGFGTKEFVRHFQQEERILAALNHPNIARIYGGAVTDKGLPCFVMEYVEGTPLTEYVKANSLGEEEKLNLFRKVCAAVSYAHQNLVLHRDLKPANIRVTQEGEPKLLDFGIARLLDPTTAETENLTIVSSGVMTPDYASPEQRRGERMTTASDTYSLGIVLYELLAGEKPRFRKDGQPELKKLGGDLDKIVAKALRAEPERRYLSVGQFSEDIRRYAEGLPIIARKDTLGYRASKFVRRNKAGVAAVVLIVLALLGGLIATTWQTRIARQERDHARVAQTKAEVARKQSEQLNGFLQNLLRSASPAKMGKDVKVVQVLDAAGKEMDRELAAEPDVLAQAHESIAFVYGQLGQVEPSEAHMQKALEIRQRIHGPDDPDTLRAELWMGSAFYNHRNWPDAERLLRQALAGRSRQNPPDLYWTARTNEVLGDVLAITKHPEESVIVLQKALADMRAIRGEGAVESMRILSSLGDAEMAAGHLEQAEADLRRTIDFNDHHVPNSSDTNDIDSIGPRIALVTCLLLQQRLPEAEQVQRRLEADCLKIQGSEGLHYSYALLLRAEIDFEHGDYAKVIEEVRHPLEVLTAASLADRTTTVQARGILGLSFTRTGRAAEGEPFLRAALAEGAKIDRQPLEFTFGNPETALGECLLAQGHYAEAEPLLLTGYDDLRTRLGEKHTLVVAASQRLQQFYSAWNKPTEAARFAGKENSSARINPVERR